MFKIGDKVKVVMTAGQNLASTAGTVVKVSEKSPSLPAHAVVKFPDGTIRPFPFHALVFTGRGEGENGLDRAEEEEYNKRYGGMMFEASWQQFISGMVDEGD